GTWRRARRGRRCGTCTLARAGLPTVFGTRRSRTRCAPTFSTCVVRPWPRSRRARNDRHPSMKREVLINASPRETRVAILEDEQLVELMMDRPDNRRMVGDIYLGRVEAVLPGIQAAFVDIGTEKSAFLHSSDLVYAEADDREDDDAAED